MLQSEDTSAYKEMFIDLLTDSNSKITKIVNKNLKVFLSNWINEYQLKQTAKSPVSDGKIKQENVDFTEKIEPNPARRQVKRRETIMI